MNDHLFQKYYAYALHVSRQYARKLKCSYFDTDDVIQCGLIGLLKAIDKYTPDKDTNFKSFAYIKIIGSIKDELRNISDISRKAIKDNDSPKLYRQYTHVESNDSLDTFSGNTTTESDLILKIDNDKKFDYIMSIFSKMPSKYQEVLYHKYILEDHYAILGARYHISESTISSRVDRGKQLFRVLAELYSKDLKAFNRLKDYPMYSMEDNTKKEITHNSDKCALLGEVWWHKTKKYKVTITLIDDDIITYIRSQTVLKKATHKRPVRISKIKFYNTFSFSSSETIIAPGITTSLSSSETINTNTIQLVLSTDMLDAIKKVFIINTPFDSEDINCMFASLKSIDALFMLTNYLMNTKSWHTLQKNLHRKEAIKTGIQWYLQNNIRNKKYTISCSKDE